MDDSGEPRGFDWEGAEDITALSERELRALLGSLFEEGAAALSAEELARVLMGGGAFEGRA
jgi:hypothetical protein